MEAFIGIAAWILAIIAGIAVATFIQRKLRKVGMRRRADYIASYAFPPELDRRLAARLPNLTAEQRRQVLEGLRQYFLAVVSSFEGRIASRLAMPSKAADEAWHEFILMTREYARFCKRAFGRFLHHHPASAAQGASQDALANTLHQFKRAAPHAAGWIMLGGVPLLFLLDRQLAMAGGPVDGVGGLQHLEARRQALVSSGAESTFTSASGPGGDDDFYGEAGGTESGSGYSGGDSGGGDSGGGGDGGGGGGGCSS